MPAAAGEPLNSIQDLGGSSRIRPPRISQLLNPTPNNQCAVRRKESEIMIASFLTIAATLLLVLFPVLVPLTITAGHAIVRWRQSYKPVWIAMSTRTAAPATSA